MVSIAAGRTIYVDDDGPADFNTIQAAINDSNDGDTIIVADGIYTGQGNRDIDFSHGLPEGQTRAVTVRSTNGPGNCIIDCQGSYYDRHRGFYFHNGEDSNSVLDGFTIINGFEIPGGGICCSLSSPTIVNCWIIGCSAGVTRSSVGGGIYGSLSTIIKCKVSGNFAALGGGIAGARIIDCIVSGNRAYNGGGVYYAHSMSNCILWGNTPDQIYGDVPTVTYSDVQGGWPGEGNIDADSCFAEPGYWDPNGTVEDANDDFWVDGDYHLKSQAGRWEPNSESWVQDAVTSPCIDAGDRLDPVGLEPFPNGGRINMGAYGGTAEASKSYFGGPICEIIVAGDVNGDCIVNYLDFRLMALNWLRDGNQ